MFLGAEEGFEAMFWFGCAFCVDCEVETEKKEEGSLEMRDEEA